MTAFLTVALTSIILLVAWAGMRLMQRATGCDVTRTPTEERGSIGRRHRGRTAPREL